MRATRTLLLFCHLGVASCSFFLKAAAFTAQGFPVARTANSPRDSNILWLTPEEERAAVLSEYLAKSHEEKLKAIQAIEQKKNAEIQELKQQLESAQYQPGPSSALTTTLPSEGQNLAAMSKEELIATVTSYQRFMSKYIIDAQEQKVKALKAAEESVAKKYEARLLALSGQSPSEAASSAAAPTVSAAQPDPLYLQRNARVSAAAAAGKSRWGSMEVDRVSKVAAAHTATTPTAPVNGAKATSSASIPPPPEVVAADHGLRNDGGVGGLTLAERVALGAAASSEVSPPSGNSISRAASLNKNEVLFQKRNSMVAAAAKAGKSRWGEMEVAKIQQQMNGALTPSGGSISSSRAIEAADHGLRADGGVDGPSLADRVNLGLSILGQS